MSIPPFNTYGVLPPGFHTATVAEFEQRLGFSPKRRDLIEHGLTPVIRALMVVDVHCLYIGGSFVTIELSPDDIDGYIPAATTSEAYRQVAEQQELWKTRYRVDLYPAATDVTGHGSQADLEKWFGYSSDHPPTAKGIVELMLGR